MLATIDLHVHELCMRVAVRVLHSCAFIANVIFRYKSYPTDEEYHHVALQVGNFQTQEVDV